MTLEQGLAVLKARCNDYHKVWTDIASSLSIPLSTPLASYLDQINNDPVTWFNAFPESLASFEALAKPKSALLHLLEKVPSVRDDVGSDFCDSMVQNISATWKQNGRKISEARIARKKAVVLLDNSDSESSATDDGAPLGNHAGGGAPVNNTIVSSLQDEIRTLRESNAVLMHELSAVKEKLGLLKGIFIDILKLKNPSEIEMKLLESLLPTW